MLVYVSELDSWKKQTVVTPNTYELTRSRLISVCVEWADETNL